MNPSTAVAEVLVDELVRHGVRHVVLAPGSRSAPLAFALVAAAGRERLRLHVRVDERVAAFTAVGLARTAGPTAVVTTSGTAVANLHPAVLEASHSGVQLIVLTADRPHEMRGTGANQTTDQVRIFGDAVRHFVDVPAPHGRADETADIRNVLARGLAAATGVRSADPGPIHLNVSFREPLVPDVDANGSAHADDAEIRPAGASRVWPTRSSGTPGWIDPSDPNAPGALALAHGRATVVVAGDGAGPGARWCAEAGGFPLLAEPSSGARSGPNAIGTYRLLLPRPEFGSAVQRAVVFGHPTLSRPVSALLARRDVETIVVAPGGGWPDAGRNAAHVVEAVTVRMEQHDGTGSGRGAGDRAGGTAGGEWLKLWQEADRAVCRVVDGVLEGAPLTGPLIAREVWSALRAGEALVAGSSNPIRDLDLTAVPFSSERPGTETAAGGGAKTAAADPAGASPEPDVFSNRGLAGIDGTLSTAGGIALGSGKPTRVLLGDLAFLHDVGGLLIGPLEEAPQLQIVVVNDDGGGIFTLLEQGAPTYAHAFERVFGTPHGADLGALCRAYGVEHMRVNDLGALRAALAAPIAGCSVIEIMLDRTGHRALHERLRAAVDVALGQ